MGFKYDIHNKYFNFHLNTLHIVKDFYIIQCGFGIHNDNDTGKSQEYYIYLIKEIENIFFSMLITVYLFLIY